MGAGQGSMARSNAKHDGRWVTRTFRVEFTTPAFLGDARQSGAWRTPPFKHLLREWWRVVYADQSRYRVDIDAMRRAESALFGAAADGEGAQSLVRLRLSRWDDGSLESWDRDPLVHHPEVGERGKEIGAHLYLGYGPLNFNRGTFLGRKEGKGFVGKRAIDAGEEARLMLAFPAMQAEALDRAFWLIDCYGAIGGRSRNGWGSILLKGAIEGALPLRDWEQCLDYEWAHAIGKDEQGPLIWGTKRFTDWEGLMRDLAQIKIGLRTRFILSLNARAGDRQLYRFNKKTKQREESGISHGSPQQRHWLSYPITNHDVSEWRQKKLRLPNSLRFKVRRDENGKLYGVIFHMPCKPPRGFRPDTRTLIAVWRQVHQFLDGENSLQRITL